MVKICLCIKIHIPAFHSNYKFSDVKENHRYYNKKEVQSFVQRFSEESLAPFLEWMRRLNSMGKEKIKVGISISGVSLVLLNKYSPNVIEQLIQLERNNTIEILSEPWSHSIVPYFDSRSLIRQVGLHDKQVYSIFGKIPKVFIIHSPQYLPYLLKTISLLGKNAVFTNLNHIEKNTELKDFVDRENSIPNQFPVLPVNYKLSRLLQKTDKRPYLKSNLEFSMRILRRFKNSASFYNPIIMVREFALINDQFRISRKIAWKNLFQNILNETDVVFLTPSEAAQQFDPAINLDKMNTKFLKQSKKPNLWLDNPLQKEAFIKQLQINTLMHMEKRESLVWDWDLAQDMQHLYFMNSKFEDATYRKVHFNPFSDPESAYVNYINVLNDFLHRLNNKNITIRKTESSLF